MTISRGKAMLADFKVSSDPNNQIHGSIEVLNDGEIKLSTSTEPIDKLSLIDREPIDFPNPDGSNQLPTRYRQNNFYTATFERPKELVKTTTQAINPPFGNDDFIPQFDWVKGKCEEGYFILRCNFNNLVSSKGFNYNLYQNFKYGLFYKTSLEDEEPFERFESFDKIDLRIDHLSTFFDGFKKLQGHTLHPDLENGWSERIYQIGFGKKQDEVESFFLNGYKFTFCSRVNGFGSGAEKETWEGVQLNILEDCWLRVEKNKRLISIEEVFAIQNIFEKFMAFSLNVPIYTNSIMGYLKGKSAEIIYPKKIGSKSKIQNHKLIFYYDKLPVQRFIQKWWENSSNLPVLYGFTIDEIYSSSKGFENQIFNHIQSLENYLNVASLKKKTLIDQPTKQNSIMNQTIYKNKVAGGGFVGLKQCIMCRKPSFPTESNYKAVLKEKLDYLVENSPLLTDLFNIKLTKIVLDIRNALAHGSLERIHFNGYSVSKKSNDEDWRKSGKKYEWSIDSVLLMFTLRKLTKYCVLKSLGFSESQIYRYLGVYDK